MKAKRDNQVVAQVTRAQKVKVKKLADKQYMTVSTWIGMKIDEAKL